MATAPAPVWAYVGPGPGLEFLPYLTSLLVWAGAAVGGILLWPLSAFFSRLRGRQSAPKALCASGAGNQSHTDEDCAASVRLRE
jgi:hypothetical protein